MSRVRTLLVDDAVDLRVMIRRALEASGRYVVVGEAGDGVEAIEQAAELSPELVLLDLSMPRMDGLEALPRLLAVSPGSAVVILSGHTRELAESAALAAGAVAYLEKGLRPTQLIDALDTARGVPADAAGEDAVARSPIEPPDTATLLSELAHDLRAQIAKTSGFLAVVRHQLEEDHDAVPAADRAREAVDRLERLLDGAMAYTRAGAESLALRVVRVGDALGDVLSDLGDGDRLDVSVRDDAEVLADRIALDRVLRNVTGNALRYSQGGEVSVVVTTEGDRGRIDVLDRGPGFTETDLEILFRPFGRGSAGTDRGGTGLGLPVAARLVQAMGGDMSAGRRSGGGARVTVHLPLAPRP